MTPNNEMTLDKLTEAKNRAEKEISESFNARIKQFEEETGAEVVSAQQYTRIYAYPNKPEDNYEVFGFKFYLKYDGQYLTLNNES